MKKVLAILIALIMVLSLTGCCLKHEWTEATCTTPRTCIKCGKTEGEPTGHLNTEWMEESVNILKAKREMVLVCDDCGRELDDKTEDIESFIDGDEFLFTAKEFVERFQKCYDDLDGGELPLTFKYSINSYGSVNFDVYNRYDYWLAWGIFYDVNGKAIEGTNEDGRINCVAIFVPEQEEVGLEAAYYLLTWLGEAACMAVDPAVTDIDVYSEPIFSNKYADGEGSDLHGLSYTCGLSEDNEYSLYIEIPD